jgi:hypothetical protein
MQLAELFKDIDFLVDTNPNTYKLEDKTRNINFAIDYATGIILGVDTDWQWDDSNYTDLPIGVTALNSGQKDYSFNDAFLAINAVEVQDQSGNTIVLEPIDLYKSNGGTITDFENVNGIPKYYDKLGSSILLYPTPNFTKLGGLIVHYKRAGQHLLVSDLTKTPGFSVILHRYLTVSASYDWALSKQHAKVNALLQEKLRYEEAIKNNYRQRSKDKRMRFIPAKQNNK